MYRRYIFKTKSIDDYRPLVDMKDIKCPWWCTGEGEDYVTILCYLPIGEDLFKYWDDAYDIYIQETPIITYTDRFKKPDWIED